MYCCYKDREELEDDLYREEEEDSEGSEANSELEFHLYSQLHYASNIGDLEEQERQGQDSQQLDVIKNTTDGDEEQAPRGESRVLSRNTNRIQQHLSKQKGEKCDNQKHDSKGQRPSFLQEVIVIDSSPEVISISEDDTTDDDKGLCSLKGQRLHQLQTSIPTPQETYTRKKSLSVPISVDSSTSETESEGSHSSDSDSDCIEHWMILGQGKQDGDQSMSLNLEGGVDSSTEDDDNDGSWLISNRDKEAQIFNKGRGARMTMQRVSNRYYTHTNVHCRNCSNTGHLSKNCPQPNKLAPCHLCSTTGHSASECPFRYCNNCGLPGHLYESCSEKAYWHKKCYRCNMTGHFFDACPEIWRQYHLTNKKGLPLRWNGENKSRVPAYCYNCSRKGHYGHACSQQRMFSRTFPTIPYINHYDTMEDINRIQHRIKFKVRDLKQAGLFPTCSVISETLEPSKKRQKLHHNQHNNQPNYKSPKTPNNYKPNSRHLVFIEKEGSLITVPKTGNNKRKVSCGSAKQWKQKRPVPASRDLLPSTKLLLDEADDFPRGGKNTERRVKKNKVPPLRPETPRNKHLKRQFWTDTTETHWLPAKWEKKEKGEGTRKRNKTWQKQRAKEMYPANDNLFLIKQRKRKS
ncbi:zinc finger CCHC domain-containing protein 7 isoform X2 [Thalassophryne amazonica]|uniref:zinc finger CCHC domain-containing protein 7 isoform X2 n=1 Tax=Thalassophryne amazonica TaxID=390379 RepID=UPI0014719A1C|nr:zinc finger CCHC domain-containing protein 7 isoform X2 [Thalassophryne amazonica]